MPVTDDTIDTVMVRLSMHYRPSLSTPAEIAATGLEYGRCLERMQWCTDEIFEEAVDWVIDNADTKGFLPPWSMIRSKCAELYKRNEGRREAQRHLQKLRGDEALYLPQGHPLRLIMGRLEGAGNGGTSNDQEPA